jgi:hypothetical protein
MNFRRTFDMLSTLFQTLLAFLGEACCHFAPPTRGVLSLRAADFAILRLFSFFPSKSLVADTNRIQREFDSNGGIAPFELALASSRPRKKTNLFKPRRAVNLAAKLPLLAKRGGVLSILPPIRGRGWGYGSKSRPKLFSMKICWLLMRVSCGAGTIGR